VVPRFERREKKADALFPSHFLLVAKQPSIEHPLAPVATKTSPDLLKPYPIPHNGTLFTL
jgi:hypothetical protein